jgi:lysophospholipase L1-like esterase
LKTSLLVVLAFFVGVLCAEVLARQFFPEWAPRTGTITQFWQFDPKYGWSHIPNTTGRFASFGFDTQVTINSEGFRGRYVPKEKQPSKTRVLVLGDSYVWGFGVQDHETFAQEIERLCPQIETVNFGVSGYGTDQELLLFRDKGQAYHPDIVILVLSGNDYVDNARSKAHVYYYKPAFSLNDNHLVLINQPVPKMNALMRGLAQIAQRSYFLTQFNRSLEAISRNRSTSATSDAALPGSNVSVQPPRAYPRTTGEAITVRLLRELAAAVHAGGSRFVVVVTEDQGDGSHWLAEAVADSRISYVFLEEVFPPAEHERFHLPKDFHWNTSGHALVARAVTASLVDNKTFPAEACSAGKSGS